MDIPDCTTVEEIRIATLNKEYIGILSEIILHGWPSSKAEVQRELHPYWSIRNETLTAYNIAIKGKIIIIPPALQESTKTAAPEPHGHREDKAAGM